MKWEKNWLNLEAEIGNETKYWEWEGSSRRIERDILAHLQFILIT